MNSEELKIRAKQFALPVIRMSDSIPMAIMVASRKTALLDDGQS